MCPMAVRGLLPPSVIKGLVQQLFHQPHQRSSSRTVSISGPGRLDFRTGHAYCSPVHTSRNVSQARLAVGRLYFSEQCAAVRIIRHGAAVMVFNQRGEYSEQDLKFRSSGNPPKFPSEQSSLQLSCRSLVHGRQACWQMMICLWLRLAKQQRQCAVAACTCMLAGRLALNVFQLAVISWC